MCAAAFERLDNELKSNAPVSVMYMQEFNYEICCQFFFTAIRKYFLKNREKCLVLIRCYYSPYFQKYSAEAHKEGSKSLVEKLGEAFKPEADVWMILNHILNVMLDLAVKVFNNEMPENDD